MTKEKNGIVRLCSWYRYLEYLNRERKDINKKIDEVKENISKISNIDDIKSFISQKLEEGIEKFNLNKDKDSNQSNTISWSSGSDSGQYQLKNQNGQFIPNKDDWEILKIEHNNKGQYKITVDNIKGRKHIGAFNWIPDEYYTDWFNI